MQNYSKIKTYSFFFGIIILLMDVLLVAIKRNFNWDYIIWLLVGTLLLYIAKSNRVHNFFRQKIDTKFTDIELQEFTQKFLNLFSLKIVVDILMRFLQNYILYANILEIIVMIMMAYLIGKCAFAFGQKKIYWIFGLLGFIWFSTIGIALGYLSIWELKLEKDEERI